MGIVRKAKTGAHVGSSDMLPPSESQLLSQHIWARFESWFDLGPAMGWAKIQ